jgi:hypothetical protein
MSSIVLMAGYIKTAAHAIQPLSLISTTLSHKAA